MSGRPARLRVLLPACLLVSLSLLPGLSAEENDPEVLLLVTSELAGVEQAFEAFDADKLLVVDVNGDGLPEIVTHNDNNHWYVIDPRTGKALHERRTFLPSSWNYREIGAPAVGDLDNDGLTDIVVGNTMGVVTRYEFDPWNSTAESFEFKKEWERQVSPTLIDPGYYDQNPHLRKTGPAFDGGPYLADAEGDGKQDIFLISDNVDGIYTFDADGNLKWGNTREDSNTNPTPADLDGDGRLEVIYVTDAGQVIVNDAATGELKWTFHSMSHGAWPASISKAPSVVDVDGDGKREIFFGARQAKKNGDPHWYMQQHANFFLVGSGGDLVWHKQFPMGAPMYSNRAAAHDCSGDGRVDFIFMDWNSIGHKPGNWENTGPPHLYCVDGRTGSLHWATKLTGTYYGNKDVIVADVDGDGAMDILVNNAQNNRDGLAWYDLSGNRKGWVGTPEGWKVVNDPVAADFTGDGNLEVAVPLSRSRDESNYRSLGVGYREGAIAILDFRVPHRVAWSSNWIFNHDWDRPYDDRATGEDPVEREWLRFTPADDGSLTFSTKGPLNASRVEAKVGNDTWKPLERADNATWSRDTRPEEGKLVRLVAYDREGKPVAFQALTWGRYEEEVLGPGDGEGNLGGAIPGPGALVAVGALALAVAGRGRRSR